MSSGGMRRQLVDGKVLSSWSLVKGSCRNELRSYSLRGNKSKPVLSMSGKGWGQALKGMQAPKVPAAVQKRPNVKIPGVKMPKKKKPGVKMPKWRRKKKATSGDDYDYGNYDDLYGYKSMYNEDELHSHGSSAALQLGDEQDEEVPPPAVRVPPNTCFGILCLHFIFYVGT